MVCLGNICRSPLAEGILRSKTSKNLHIDSVGTNVFHKGRFPDPRSIEIAKKNMIDISRYRSRQITKKDFNEFNYIFAMDKSNYRDLIKLGGNHEENKKISLILGKGKEVSDPYYENYEAFELCFSILDNACDQIVKKLFL